MIVVIAGRNDVAARLLASRWATVGASLLTPDDLSRAGWRQQLGAQGSGSFVTSGRRVPTSEVTGVYTRLPCVYESDLTGIAQQDRQYVAVEMSSFLLSWLSELSVPIINPPNASCLSGPSWRPEQWVHAAARLGIRVRPVVRHTSLEMHQELAAGSNKPGSSPGLKEELSTVTIVGGKLFGAVDRELAAQAEALARASGTAFLKVYFDGPSAGAEFVTADSRPQVDSVEVEDALLTYLGQRTKQSRTTEAEYAGGRP